MKRRHFITLLASVAVARPLAAHGQQVGAPARRIAVLLRVAKDDPDAQRDLQAFRDGLQALGWSGKTILIEYRYASADPAQMDIYAAELVGLPAEAILAGGSLAVAALRRATQTTPIVSTVAMLCHLRPPSLLMRARALATVREWKKRLERQAHSRSIDRGSCGLPVETGAMA